MGEYIKYVQKKGIRAIVEIGSNLGHGNPTSMPVEQDITTKIRYMRGKDGKTVPGNFCPVGEEFLNYQCEMVKCYAKYQPDAVYLDDDLRLEWHGEVEWVVSVKAA